MLSQTHTTKDYTISTKGRAKRKTQIRPNRRSAVLQEVAANDDHSSAHRAEASGTEMGPHAVRSHGECTARDPAVRERELNLRAIACSYDSTNRNGAIEFSAMCEP